MKKEHRHMPNPDIPDGTYTMRTGYADLGYTKDKGRRRVLIPIVFVDEPYAGRADYKISYVDSGRTEEQFLRELKNMNIEIDSVDDLPCRELDGKHIVVRLRNQKNGRRSYLFLKLAERQPHDEISRF